MHVRRICIGFVLGVICLLTYPSSALLPINGSPKEISRSAEYRLPTAFAPEHYKLNVITYLKDEKDFKFNGNVRIRIKCNEDSKRIVLHSRRLSIDESAVTLTKLDKGKTTEIPIKNFEYEESHDFLIIHVGEALIKGETFELYLPFEAPLENRLQGYYLSSYVDKKSNKREYLTITQFESTYARLAFPCFDEPAMKAKFQISLAHEKRFISLSNMPIRATEEYKDDADWQWNHFEETVPMSTYLVAYSVNSFEYREAVVQMNSEVKFRIYARPDAIDQVEYAKTFGPSVLKYYENYFDIKFPLPKMDMIAIPDFSAGAMENWGLVTYRESLLLYSPERSSSNNQQAVASVIAHELAHQWFGNLVTMRWWDDLWLNEGFATYVASLGVHHLNPEWNSFEEESIKNLQTIFSFDAMRSSHPVKVEISNPSTIFQIFDAISYRKGSNIIRMMHRFLGEESFRWGVHNYLKKHEYANAEQDNLWESLTEEAHRQNALPKNLTVKDIMDKWTLQTGYPTITVDRNYEKKTATITQRRTLSNTQQKRTPDEENCWWVPLSYTSAHEPDFNSTHAKDWLECTPPTGESKRSEMIPKTLENQPDQTEWVIYNVDISGLYKVQYDTKNWDLLIQQLSGPDFKKIATTNRAQLIDDSLELAWNGEQDYSIALRLINFLRNEDEYIPWFAALNNLDDLRSQLKRTPKFGLFKEYMRKIITPVYEKLGGLNVDRKDADRADVIKQKIQIGAQACIYGVKDCTKKATENFAKWMATEDPDNTNPVPVDLRRVVYCNAIRHGGQAEWDFLWARYLKSNVASERNTIQSSLACSREVWVLSRYLDYSLNETKGIRNQDVEAVFSAVATNDVGYFLARSFFEQNLQTLYDKFAPDTSRLTRFIKSLANQMATNEESADLKEFLDTNARLFVQNGKGIEQALETIEINNQWREKNYVNIGRYLNEVADN